MKKKVIIFISILLVISAIFTILIIKNKNNNLSKTSSKVLEQNEEIHTYNDEINIREVSKEKKVGPKDNSKEFIEKYLDDYKRLQDNNNKDNILTIISKEKPKNTYGATDIVTAPNNQYLLQYKSKKDKNNAINNLKVDPNISSVEENIKYKIENTTYNSWGIERMSLDYAIECSEERILNDVTVAIIDTGCDIDLVNKYYPGKIIETYNVLKNSTEIMSDQDGHGTHVAGTIAEGTPSNVKIIPVKVSDDGEMYHTDIIAALNYITSYKKADVINMSFGGTQYDTSLKQAIDAANQENIISVAAAGNENTSLKHYPSGYKSTIAISSVDSNLNKSSFSNFGADITFCAPGTNIKSLMGKNANISVQNGNNDDDEHETISGTSMATPHAVSAVAILKSYNKGLTLDDITELLKKSSVDLGDKGWDKYYGYGLISFDNVEFRDGEDYDQYNVFKKDIKDREVLKIDAVNSITPTINYGNITNILNAEINIYYGENTYYTSKLWNLDDIEITEYEPYNYEIQEVTINYKGKTTKLIVNNQGASTKGWSYEVIDENKIRLTEFKVLNTETSPKKIYIPNTFDGHVVKEIGNGLFSSNKSIVYVILPDTITKINDYAFRNSSIKEVKAPQIDIEIGKNAFEDMEELISFTGICKTVESCAFADCPHLDNLTLSENLIEIGNSAFLNDLELEHINIPNSITNIGRTAFDCTKINSITIPSGVTKIEEYTFNNCTNLESVTFSENLVEIDKNAFRYTSIRKLYIPANVTNIDNRAFSYIGSLETIEVNENNVVYDSRDNCNAIIDTSTNTVLRASNDTIIPQSVTKIGDCAYTGTSINDIYTAMIEYPNMFIVPEHITNIGDYAFDESQCNPIRLSRNVSTIGEKAFGNKNTLIFVYSDSYAKEYVTENEYNYRHIDPNKVLVSIPKKEYKAFETVDTTDMEISLVYEEAKRRIEYYYHPDEFNIIYNNNRDCFLYGDTSFVVSLYNPAGEYIEKEVNVTVQKAIPTYIQPVNLTGNIGQKLSEIQLPEHFEWMDEDEILEAVGNVTFKARYIPSDTQNYETIENINVVVNISGPEGPEKPTSIHVEGEYTYSGIEQIANINGFNSETMNISGNKQINAGTYSIEITSKTGKWADGTSNSITIPWEIKKAEQSIRFKETYLEKSVNSAEFTNEIIKNKGNGEISYNSSNNAIAEVDFNGKVKIKKVGQVTITATISETQNYKEATASYTLNINKAIPIYTIPTNLIANIGQKLSEIQLPEHFEWTDDDQILEQVGNVTFKARYIPSDTQNYETIEDIDISVNVLRLEDPEKPTLIQVEGEYIYNGIEQIANINGFNFETMNISGNKQINAGTYNIEITSKTGKWADGTSNPIIVLWEIEKAEQDIKFSKTKIEKYIISPEFTNVLIKNCAYGEINYNTTNDAIADIDSNGKITIKRVGQVTITATISETQNYKEATVSYILIINQTTIDESYIKLEYNSTTYNAKNKQPNVNIIINNVLLLKGRDFKVEYKNNKNIGIASIIATGIGNYNGKITKTFIINPKGTSLSKLTAGKKKFTAKWKKQATQTIGYQIQYSTDKNFKKDSKTSTISKNKTLSKVVSKLKSKKKYYVRIRTYKTVSGKKYYSGWSISKSIKTK